MFGKNICDRSNRRQVILSTEKDLQIYIFRYAEQKSNIE